MLPYTSIHHIYWVSWAPAPGAINMIELVSYLQPAAIHRIKRENLNSELGKPNKGNENKI